MRTGLVLALWATCASCSSSRREKASDPPAASERRAPEPEVAVMPAPTRDYRVLRPRPGAGLYFDAIERMWDSIDLFDVASTDEALRPATPGQRAVFAAQWYQVEVNNGGHHQYFFNSAGILWEETLAGLALIGADEHRALLARAVATFPGGRPSRDREERIAQLEKLSGRAFDELDTAFYALDSLEELMNDYVRAHPEEFFR